MDHEHEKFNNLRSRLLRRERLWDEDLSFLRKHGAECPQCCGDFYQDLVWVKYTKDPATRSIAAYLAARLRQELESGTVGKRVKRPVRPAHEVILSKLRERLRELALAEDVYDDGLCALGAVAALLDLLREMVIPQGERSQVLAEILSLAEYWKGNIPTPNMPQDLYDLLSAGS